MSADRFARAESLAAQVRAVVDADLANWRWAAQHNRDLTALDAALALLRDALVGMERHAREEMLGLDGMPMESPRAALLGLDRVSVCFQGCDWPCPDYAAWERTATAAEASIARCAALYGVSP